MKNKKELGQHWLYNRAILDEIANEASAVDFSGSAPVTAPKDTNSNIQSSAVDFPGRGASKPALCLEIGPGLGTLTSSLLKRFEKVIAVEFDARLAQNLPNSFPGKNLKVINADILKFDFSGLKSPYVVAGNIPYYITSPIIEKLLTLENPPVRIVLLIQKEVADRILSDKSSVLSLMVQNRATAFPGIFVPKSEFIPPPKVDSATIILEPHPPIASEDVFHLISTGFKSPRKKLVHNLSAYGSKAEIETLLQKIGLNPSVRPSDLNLEDWQKLYAVYG